jgi:hypothetical protein
VTGASIAFVSIYRSRNAAQLQRVLEPARTAGWAVALWALDDPVQSLSAETVGVGPGEKLPLVNEILARSSIDTSWLVVCDDDVAFTRGDVVSLVDLVREAGLDLAQPARSDDNSRYEHNVAHPITKVHAWSRTRRTTFVEIGPVFVVGPRWRDSILPFPADRGMGWGIELDWNDLHERGCRLGIVDAVSVAHLGEPGGDYDFDGEVGRMHAELSARGLRGWGDVQKTLAVWRPWQRVPPWRRGEGGARRA